jgi:hypothetical protein
MSHERRQKDRRSARELEFAPARLAPTVLVSFAREIKKGGLLRSRRLELMLSLSVDFDFYYTWSAMFVMIVTASLVPVATVSLAHV